MVGYKKGKDYKMGVDGLLRFKNTVCVPWGPRLRKRILEGYGFEHWPKRNDFFLLKLIFGMNGKG